VGFFGAGEEGEEVFGGDRREGFGRHGATEVFGCAGGRDAGQWGEAFAGCGAGYAAGAGCFVRDDDDAVAEGEVEAHKVDSLYALEGEEGA